MHNWVFIKMFFMEELLQVDFLLVKVLVQAAPPEQAHKVEAALTAHGHTTVEEVVLEGPVVNAEGRSDVVSNQGEVDDLLASLGF